MRMTIFLLCLSFATSAFAEVLQNPYFFEISRDGMKSYIFGTYHFGFTKDDVPEFILNALRIKPNFMSEDGVMSDGQPNTTDFSGAPLDDFAVQQLRDRGISEDRVKALIENPKAACIYYYFAEGIGRDLDKSLYQYAKWEGKSPRDLDDKRIEKVSQDIADKCDFNKMARDITPAQAHQFHLNKLAEYRAGNPKGVVGDTSELMGVEQRNKSWIPKIVEAHKQGAFVIFGNGHLVGPSGILKLLSDDGFKIRRITRVEDF